MSSLPKESPKHLNVTFNDQEQIQVSFTLKKEHIFNVYNAYFPVNQPLEIDLILQPLNFDYIYMYTLKRHHF